MTALHRSELAHQRRRFAVTLTVFTALFVALEARFFYLQILRGDDFRERARISAISSERIPPRRGLIRDRKGKLLATNAASFRVELTPHYVARSERRGKILDSLQLLLPMSDEDRKKLDQKIDEAVANRKAWEPLTVAKALVSDTSPEHGGPLEALTTPLTTMCSTCPSTPRRPIAQRTSRMASPCVRRSSGRMTRENSRRANARHAGSPPA